MKVFLFSLLFLFIPKLVLSQGTKNDKIIYLDSLWQETSKEKHIYYRIIKDYYSDLKEYKIYDYYKNNILKTSATIGNKNNGSYRGEKTTYYPNGNKKNITYYIKGDPIGKTINYYENGNLKDEGENTANYNEPGKYYKLNQYWDENNNHLIIDGNGTYLFRDNSGHTLRGTYKDGYKDGIFEGENLNLHTSYKEEYKNGKFIKGTRTFADNTKSEYFEIEKKSFPKKGMKDFNNFFETNFKYTKEALINHIKGTIFIKFTVDRDGKIINPIILKGLGYGLDEEAISVLLKYENWIPGEQRGKKVRCSFSFALVTPRVPEK